MLYYLLVLFFGKLSKVNMEKLMDLDIEMTSDYNFDEIISAIKESTKLPLLNEDFASQLQRLQKMAKDEENELKVVKVREKKLTKQTNDLMASLNEKLLTKEEIEKNIEEIQVRIDQLQAKDDINGLKISDFSTLEVERKLLNAYKCLLKVKWSYDTPKNEVSGSYLKPVSIDVEKVDNSTVYQMWEELGKACNVG